MNRFLKHSVGRRYQSSKPFDALCIGVLESKETFKLPSFLAAASEASVAEQLKHAKFSGKSGQIRLLYGLEEAPILSVVGLGAGKAADHRSAASLSVQTIVKLMEKEDVKIGFSPAGENAQGKEYVCVDVSGLNEKAVAEGASLAAWNYKNEAKIETITGTVSLDLIHEDAEAKKLWAHGRVTAEAQNLARSLAESPANIINPTSFSDKAVTLLEGTPKVSVRVHDREWAEVQGMGAFLSVSNGSDQPPKFLELIYMNGPVDKIESPHILIGKGVTFDAGGISIKPSTDMAMMKGDMSGAASTLAAFKAAVDLNLPINLVALIPLTENLINGRATKPGDIVRAMNGKTIEVDNTDAEGRLILADAICYACKNWTPSSVVEMSTLTGAMDVALGYHFAGVFTNSESLWDALESSGKKAGDPFWRMPLDDAYKSQIKSNVADLKNVGGRSGGACTAAIFLKEFIDKSQDIPFAHVDIAGVMHKRSGPDFLASGMTGRPTRSIIEYLIYHSTQ